MNILSAEHSADVQCVRQPPCVQNELSAIKELSAFKKNEILVKYNVMYTT